MKWAVDGTAGILLRRIAPGTALRRGGCRKRLRQHAVDLVAQIEIDIVRVIVGLPGTDDTI